MTPPDVLVGDFGWRCLRVRAESVRTEDVLLPGTYGSSTAYKTTVSGPFLITGVTSTPGSHIVSWWFEKSTKWFRLNRGIEVVILRKPEPESQPVFIPWDGQEKIT